MPKKVKVKIAGKGAEIAGISDIETTVTELTPIAILREIAKQNPLIADSLIRGDGNPRSSTKVLINGRPPSTLDQKLDAADDIVVVMVHSCDG